MRATSAQKKKKKRWNNVAILATLKQVIPKARGVPIVANIERILQPVTDFIRGNPIVSTAIVGAGTTGLVVAVAGIKRARKAPKKKRKKAKKKAAPKRRKSRKKKTKAQIKRQRLRNLKKARRARKKGKRRRIVRGRGLGTHEIKHSGKSTKGKFKLVKFRDKRTGKMVSFKARR